MRTCLATHPLDEFLLYRNNILIFAATALDYAAQHGHIAIVTELLKHHPLLEQCAWDKHTPLHRAAVAGHQAMVDLLAARSDPNTGTGYNTLLIADCHSNLEPKATTFIDQMSTYALDAAIERRRLHITQLMFARGIASADRLHLHLAVLSGETDVTEYLLQNSVDTDAGSISLHPIIDAVSGVGKACAKGPRATVELLLDAFEILGIGDRVLSDDNLLRRAVNHGKVDVVKLLLEPGTMVNALIGKEQ
ncbi:hypothetical protein Q9L58_006887 [Maublancomyces gigas]|uniref:Ankyrin repeat protein n=1 Tax=Discina gigas TaxID=1032678 RepID=A0ABR3GF82_9PEZI